MAEEKKTPAKKKPAKKKQTPIDLVSLNEMAKAGFDSAGARPRGQRFRHSKLRKVVE